MEGILAVSELNEAVMVFIEMIILTKEVDESYAIEDRFYRTYGAPQDNNRPLQNQFS